MDGVAQSVTVNWGKEPANRNAEPHDTGRRRQGEVLDAADIQPMLAVRVAAGQDTLRVREQRAVCTGEL